MIRIGVDRIGRISRIERIGSKDAGAQTPTSVPAIGRCPVDDVPGIFLRTALVCPRCQRLLGGF